MSSSRCMGQRLRAAGTHSEISARGGRKGGNGSAPPGAHFSTRVRSADPPSLATMQYFTPQEMAGGVRYGGKCKVGNWNENAILDEVRFRARSAKPLHAFVRRASRQLGAPPTTSDPPIPSPAADSRPGVPGKETGWHAEDGPAQSTHGQGARTGTSAFRGRRIRHPGSARVSANLFFSGQAFSFPSR